MAGRGTRPVAGVVSPVSFLASEHGSSDGAAEPTEAPVTDTLIPAIDEARAEIADLDLRTRLFIGGKFRDAASGRRFTTENPATGRPITEVAEGGPADVDAAGAAARRAADDGRWARLSPGEREQIL